MGQLKESLIKGTIYTGIAKYSSLIVSLVVSAILARSLSPTDFGTVAIATFFIGFFSSLTVAGFSPAIIQNRDLDSSDIENIYSFTVLLGLILAIIFASCSHSIAAFYKDNIYLENICYLLSINIFFSIICIVPNAILLKEKEFKFISKRMLFVNVIGGILSVLAIYIHWGIYALVVNPIFSGIVIYLITIKKRPVKYRMRYKWESIHKILNYSVYQMLFNLVYIIYRGVDKLIIGKFFDMRMLGYYEKSYRLMFLPLDNVTSVLAPVLHPILSDIQNDRDRVYSSYLKIVKFLSEIGFLLTVYMFFTSRELILLVFGPQWEPAVPIFKILALSIGIQMTQSPVGSILQTFNKVKELFYCSLICLLLVSMALFLGVYLDDMLWTACFLTIAFYIIYLIYNIVICRVSNQNLAQIIKCIIVSIIKVIPLCALLMLIDVLNSCDSNMILTLFEKTGISLFYFILALYLGVYNDIPLPAQISKIRKFHKK